MRGRSPSTLNPLLRASAALVATVLCGAALGGCAEPTPWVKPYEREHFADPIMSFNRDPVSNMYLEHVFDTSEGAHGATGIVGGGCGCN